MQVRFSVQPAQHGTPVMLSKTPAWVTATPSVRGHSESVPQHRSAWDEPSMPLPHSSASQAALAAVLGKIRCYNDSWRRGTAGCVKAWHVEIS